MRTGPIVLAAASTLVFAAWAVTADATTASVALTSAAVVPASPRDLLTNAVFASTSKTKMLIQIDAAKASADAVLTRAPTNREAQLIRAMAIGYRAKLTRSRIDALTAKALFDRLAKTDPRDADAQAVVGGWHLDAIAGVGAFMARAMLGADRAIGLAALDRAVLLGGNRAFYPALAALLRWQLSGDDRRAAALARLAAAASTPTLLDRQLQRGAIAALAALRAGDAGAVQRTARAALPLGRVSR